MGGRRGLPMPLYDHCGCCTAFDDHIFIGQADIADLRPLRRIEITALQRLEQQIGLVRLGLDHDPATEMIRFGEMSVIGGDQRKIPAIRKQKV